MAHRYHVIDSTGAAVTSTDSYDEATDLMVTTNLANKSAGNPVFLEVIDLELRHNAKLADQIGYHIHSRDGAVRRS